MLVTDDFPAAAEAAQTGSPPIGAFAAITSTLKSSPTAVTAVYQDTDATVFRLDLRPAPAASAS
jgi:hypothetical protein